MSRSFLSSSKVAAVLATLASRSALAASGVRSSGEGVSVTWWARRRGGFGVVVSLVVPALVVTTVGVGVSVSPARAAAAPAAVPSVPTPTQAGDRVSAGMIARSSGLEVEVTGERTETSTTWVRPDGTLRSEFATSPVRVQRPDTQGSEVESTGGEWLPVDYELAETVDGWVPKASPTPVTFSAGGSGPAAVIGSGVDAVSLDWPGRLPAPTVEGATATYALPGGEQLVLTANATGFEQSLVLTQRPAPGAVRRLRLALGGKLTLKPAGSNGSFDLARPGTSGATVFHVPAPVMYSAKLDPVTGEHTQVQAMTATTGKDAAGGQVLDVAATAAFLDDPETVYPVVLDPTIASVGKVGDTYVTQDNSLDHSADYDLRLGVSSLGNIRRSLLQFTAGASLAGMHVTNASLNLFEVDAGSCTATPMVAYPIIAAWNQTTVTYSNQPAVNTSGSYSGTATFAHGNETLGCANAADSINVTNMVDAWAKGTLSDFGLELRASDESAAATAQYKQFCAMNGGSTNCNIAANQPILSVTYNSIPGVPTGADFSPKVIRSDGALLATSLNPSFTGTATNIDGANYRLELEISHNPLYTGEGTGVMWTGQSAPTTPGAVATVTPPPSTFSVNTHDRYRMRAAVTNGAGGTDYSTAWTAYTNFSFNTVPPVAPTITCGTTYVASEWKAQAPGAVTCTLDTASGDGTGYVWGLDNPTPDTELPDGTQTGQPLTVLITPAVGWHTLYAFARDTALHVSTLSKMSFGVGTGGVLSPAALDSTAKAVALSSSAQSAYTKITYQWAKGATGTSWVDIPVANVTPNGSSTPIGSWPLTGTTTGNVTSFSGYNWDVAATLAAAAQADGAVQIRAVFATATNTTFISPAVTFSLNRGVFSSSAPTTEVGPGTVSLLSGDFGVDEVDAALNGLSVGRSMTNLSPMTNTGAAGVFGPGWTAALTGAGASGYVLNAANQSVGSIVLKAGDGTQLVYTQSATNTFTGIDDADDGSVLTYSTSLTDPATGITANGWQLKDADGTVTTWFTRNGVWQPVRVDPPATADDSLAAYDTSGRPTTLLAPAPTGVTCTIADHNRAGCQWLSISYATATTATGTLEAAWGDYLGQVTGISWTGYDPATTAMVTKNVASYLYDNTAHLRTVWDPRLPTPLKTRYTYTAAGRLASTQAPGRNAQNLNYDTSGRLASVSWSDPIPANGTATQAVAYGLAVNGVTGAPDVSAATAAAWGQTTDLPYVGGAVFPPSQVPTVNGATGAYTPTATQWPYASVTYADVNGQVVNTAAYGAGAWQVDSARYNADGNQIWTLSAGNRAQALTPTTSTDPYVAAQATSAARADLLAQTTTYTTDGVDVVSTLGPAHPARLSSGATASVRIATSYTYDEGAPAGGPYRLSTTITTRPAALDGTSVPAADVRIVRTGYAPIDGASATGPTSGWTLRSPTTQTVQMGTTASSADLVSKTRYDTVGRTVESRLPGGVVTDANTTITTYYTAAANATYPACGGKAYFEGLVCRTDPGGAASAGYNVPAKVYTYDLYGQVLTLAEASGAVTRTSTATYDAAGRPSTSALSVTGLASSTAVPSGIVTYDPATGDTTGLTAGTASLTATFDALGRRVTQVDADASTSTYTYDIDGNVKTLNDGKATYTYSYATSTEHRGLVTSIDTGMGSLSTFTGSYDPAANLTGQTYPNGTAATYTYDNVGAQTALTYTLPTYSGGPTANVLSFTNVADAFGQTAHSQSPASAQDFMYDHGGRLTRVADTYTGSCTTRAYGFDRQSDRTSLTTYGSASGGTCQTATPTSSKNSTYDNANRITNTGYSFDQLGRTLTVPLTDLGSGTSALSVAYYDNDKPFTQTQGPNVKTFTLDPAGRYRQATDTTSSTETRRIINHYNDTAGDSPTWIATSINSGATWTWQRNVTAFGGLAAIQDSTGSSTLQLANLHGDIIATLNNHIPTGGDISGSVTSSYSESTEYGLQRLGSAAASRYNWLGSAQRSTDTLGALSLMGARLYNSSSGQFLSSDPVSGANPTSYVYPVDPVNQTDLSGMCNDKTVSCMLRVLTTSEPYPAGFIAYLGRRGQTARFARTKAGWRAMEVGGDGCSKAPDTGWYWNFKNACDTHDLAWQLLRFWKVNRTPNSRFRVALDNLFKSDMYADCAGRSWYPRQECRLRARAYYTIVRRNSE